MTPFQEFQMEEYGKIAEAHFKTIESISAFFRYYLILMAVPLSLVGAFVAVASRAPMTDGLERLFSGAKSSVGIVFAAIGIIGFFLMSYVASLRFDALLYARTVNAIRKFFYDGGDEGFMLKARMRTLPQNAFEPPYFEDFFLPVVLVFAFFNSVYLYLGWIFVADRGSAFLPGDAVLRPPLAAVAVCGTFFIVHLIAYGRDAKRRESAYLQRGSIGVDIDGVLNRHRQHFASTLSRNGGPTIDPDAIVFLPVRDTPSLGVTRQQEVNVFNSPEYWLDMIADPEASHYVRALKEMGLKIHLVSNRPWPDLRRLHHTERARLKQKWNSEAQRLVSGWSPFANLWATLVYISLASRPVIELFTKAWLKEHEIPFDSLTIERSLSADGVHHSTDTKSRVQVARKHSLKFFVEDDWDSAFRLAFVCDVVFLIRHPYNEAIATRKDLFGKGSFTEALPTNVIVVDGWADIHRAIRRLM